MEETLTECMIKVRDDLTKLKKGWDYLDTNALEEFRFTWRFNESRSIILEVCSSQNTPEIDDLEKCLHNFHFLVSTNENPNVWTVFGYELSVICAKLLSSIERLETFEVMFSTLLTIINKISEHNLDVWKATARQILNLFINKKFTPEYFKTILKKYIVTLRNIDAIELYNFSVQNFHLVKTLLTLVQRTDEYETQSAIMTIVFLHLQNNRTLMSDIYVVPEEDSKLNQPLTFEDFEQDCRLYLNILNKPHGGPYKNVYSISCHVLSLGGYLVKPLIDRKVISVDANKETERVSIKYFDSEDQSAIYLMFSEIIHVQMDSEKTEGNCSVTITTKNFLYLHSNIKYDKIYLVAKGGKDVIDFVNFLKTAVKKKGKFSKTKPLLIDRCLLSKENLQVNAVSSSARPEVDTFSSLSNGADYIISAFGNPDEDRVIPQTQIKTPPFSSEEQKIVLETPDSPSFFANIQETFEDTSQRQKVLQSKSHKHLSSQKKFLLEPIEEPIEEPICFAFGKENQPPSKQETYEQKSKPQKDNAPIKRVLRERTQKEAASEDCFRQNVQQKKPSLPKFKRKKTEPKAEKKKKQPRRNARYKPLPIQEIAKQPESSLLDPNGYAFQRWKQPTTSERSNFWLKKLNERSKQKADVFQFSDSDSELNTKSKRKIVNSKRRYRKQKYDSKRPSLKRVTVFLKNVKKLSPEKKKPNQVALPEPDKPDDTIISQVLPQPSLNRNEPTQPIINKLSTTAELSSEEEPHLTQKRDRSQEENSLTRVHLKKKHKTKLSLLEAFPLKINRRLQKAEDTASQQTNEIIATINKAADHFTNHLQRKQEMKIASYLKMTEEAMMGLQAEAENLNARARRLQKAILYFKAGCSVSELHQSLKNHFDKIRNTLKEMETKVDQEKKINCIVDRLKTLIDSEISKSIKIQLQSKQKQLVKFSSILGLEFE